MPYIKPISLDGSTLEGGGQLVRVALSLSAITGVPIHIYNIRANRAPRGRPRPSRGRGGNTGSSSGSSYKVDGGLKESHLAALQFLAYHCDAYTEGAELDSREVTFIPGAGYSKTSKGKGQAKSLVDFETNQIHLERPGSVMLILQAILPFLIFGKIRQPGIYGSHESQNAENGHPSADKFELTIRGGTNVSKSMSGEYVKNVFLPLLEQIGIEGIEVDVLKRGWAGNVASTIGEVMVRVPLRSSSGFSLPGFNVKAREDIEAVSVSLVGDLGVSKDFFEKNIVSAVTEHIGDVPVTFETVEDSGDLRRFYLQIAAHDGRCAKLSRDFIGTGKLPKNQAEAERMAQVAIKTVLHELTSDLKKGGCVDEFMQDQLVIFQALASGESQVDGGRWKTDSKEVEEDCGDNEGSLHTRTVRWVCKKILSKIGTGVEFASDGKCHGIGWNGQTKT